MRRINFETDQPFVIGALAHDSGGQVYLVPTGIVIAAAEDEAHEMATFRWPTYTLVNPIPWERVDPEHRLMALEADRQIPFEKPFRLFQQ